MSLSRAADYKAVGGKLVRVRLVEENEKIRSVRISGDFFLLPEDDLPALERMLEGVAFREADLRTTVEQFFETHGVKGLGVSSNELVEALMAAKEEVVVFE